MMIDKRPDQVDAILREHGRKWAAEFDEPERKAPAPSPVGRRWSWWRPAAAAVAVLAVATAVTLTVTMRTSPADQAPIANEMVQSLATGATPTVEPEPTGVDVHGATAATSRDGTMPTVVTSRVPTTIGRSGQLSLIQEVGFVSVFSDSSDPARLWVTPNTFGPTGGGTGCSPVVHVTVTLQNPDRVEIIAATYASSADTPMACTDVRRDPSPIAIQLLAALGNRKVIDGSEARTLTVLDPEDYPEPTHLPEGYRSSPGLADAPKVVRSGDRVTRTYSNGPERIEIAWIEGTFKLGQASQAIITTSVDGVPATVWKDKGFDDTRMITWSPGPRHYITIQSNASQGDPLTSGELVRIAESIPTD